MDYESTDLLMNVLKSARAEDLPAYRRAHLKDLNLTFPVYMDQLIRRLGISRRDLFQRADIPQKYGYKLLSGESHTTDRDKLLRLFFAMELNLEEVQRGLELYGLAPLYPKRKRDAVLIIAFHQGIHRVDEVDELLMANGEPPLARCRD